MTAWIVGIAIAFLVIDAIGRVALIGVPRKPISKGEAAWSVFWSFACIVALVWWVRW